MNTHPEALALLDALLDLPATQREARLAAIAARDEALAATLAAWLRADARADARLDDGPVAARMGLQMPLPAPGQRIGAYRLVRELGRGGMGQVWLGERVDGDFRQQVAIKLAHPAIGGSEGEARFRRERQILAGLRHPHIAQLLDGGLAPDGRAWLAMEWVEGRSLREEIRDGALPLRRVLAIGTQVAEALAHAHAAGVVHRDLKPENILVTRDGYAKVLDFGIAKLLGDTSGATVHTSETAPGQILGTVAYMSPEQAGGRAVDFRSDQFSLGAVLYEMATGHAAFSRDTQRETLGAVMLADPPGLDGGAPPLAPVLLPVLRRCLSKEPAERYAATLDLAHDLKSAASGAVTSGRVASVPRRGRWRTPVLAMLGGAALASLAWWALRPAPEPPREARPVLRVEVPIAPAQKLWNGFFAMHSLALSRDARRLAFSGEVDGERRLYVRELDGRQARPLPGSDGASNPVFSPDGEWIAFFANQKLKKIAVGGGGAVVLAEAPNALGGIAWPTPGRLVFSPHPSTGLMQVSADGGEPEVLTEPDVARGEASHVWPSHVPGTDVLLYVAEVEAADSFDAGRIHALDPARAAPVLLVDGGSDPRVDGDTLYYARAGTVYAVDFDVATLSLRGAPRVLHEGVMYSISTGAAQFDVQRGVAVRVAGGEGADLAELVVATRDGSAQSVGLPPGVYERPRISPDGRRLAFSITAADDDLWTYDLESRLLTRITDSGENFFPVWTPDGGSLVYTHHPTPTPPAPTLYRRAAHGGGQPERLVEAQPGVRARLYPDVSPDGRFVVYAQYTLDQNFDLWMLDLESGENTRWLGTPNSDVMPRFSPDGRYIAFASFPSLGVVGQVHVQARDGSQRWQVSVDGGSSPAWRGDSRELFFSTLGGLYAVSFDPDAKAPPGAPRRLFEGPFSTQYDVFPDGQRFLMRRRVEKPGAQGPILIDVSSNE